MTQTAANLPTRVLGWLRAGYPEGVPVQDYIPLIGVLRRNLTDEDIAAITADLGDQWGGKPFTADEIRRMIEDTAIQQASEDDIARVSAHLFAGGWPLAVEV